MCRLHPFRGTEITDLVIAEFINVQVRGIDITVDDAFLLTEGQRGADVLSYLQYLSNSERYAAPLMVGHHIDETSEALHSDIEGARIGSIPEIEIIDLDDVRRTAEGFHDPDLVHEHFRDIFFDGAIAARPGIIRACIHRW